MSTYTVSTKIESNVPADNLLYDLTIYRMDSSKKKHYILSGISKQPVQPNYETLKHQTSDTTDPTTTIYMVEIMLYRKHLGNVSPALKEPFIRMYTLDDLIAGKACSEKKRENACYFESTGQTELESKGDNTIELRISVPERQFIAKEYPVGSPRDLFKKDLFEFELVQRLDHFDYPYQGSTSLCGPAALFYSLLIDRPDIYKQVARELWQYGTTKIGKLRITPGNSCKRPSGSFYYDNGRVKVSGLDWITLASLRDSENAIFSYSSAEDEAAGVTMWGMLSEWFEKVGYQKVFDNISLSTSNLKDILDLNEYHNRGYLVVSLISAGMLTGLPNQDTSSKNHWVVWNGTLAGVDDSVLTNETNLDTVVNLNCFSWGEVKAWVKKEKSLNYVLNHIFGALVFKRVL
ncbi:hypothetical protein [Providencia rustigianii]|uniref:hypothetical protein n=1 Tax=Providencia rustigianii TaxID=158850 RepID=UPI002244A2C8|nr:hypothetical protein [Providencia rustigianii]